MNRPFVNGNREQTNNFIVDGFDVNETLDNRVAYQPSPDALAEIGVETNNYTADTGNVGGAVVAMVTKSGTNDYRGNVFEFYRNSDFDANTWENNRSGAAKQERRQDIYGFTLGGPVSRDRLFFFGDYQGSRQDAPGFGTASVAPDAWRRGDLSSVAAAIRDPQTGQPFPGNQIPTSRFGPIARALFADTASYPLSNRTVPGGIVGNYVGETLLKIRGHQGDVRVDWNASASDKFFARYSFATYEDAARRQSLRADAVDPQRPAVLEHRRQLEPHLRPDHGQRDDGRLQPHPGDLGDRRLGRARRRQRPLRHRRRPADRRPQPDQLRQRPDAAGSHRPRLGDARQDLPDQREAHLAAGPPHLQVRRSVAGLRPAAVLRRQQRPARVPQLQRLLHRQPVRRLPARPVVGQGPRRRRPGRPVDAPAEPHRRCSSRTTSSSARTSRSTSGCAGPTPRRWSSRTTGRPTSTCRPASRSPPATAASRTARSTSRTTGASSRGSAWPGS